MNTVVVAAGVLIEGGRVLLTQRRSGTHLAGAWEFPGGKVDPGEDPREALRRELAEELGCDASVGPLLLRHAHRYPEHEVDLSFYACQLPPGAEPAAIGVAELAWARIGTLATYDFLEADRAVLAEIERLA